MFRYFAVLLALVGMLTAVAFGHNRQVAADGCHKSGSSYHCHSADTTIGFLSNQARYYEIANVTDGDTIDFIYSDEGNIETRLYGVDTPESHSGTKVTNDAKAVLKTRGITKTHVDYDALLEDEKARQLELGEKAKQYVKDTLKGKDVFVLFEDADAYPFIKIGKYGRYLAYVFYADATGTRMLNLELIVEGHAEVDYLDNPFRYRWAFIDSDIDEVRHDIASVALPVKLVARSPSQHASTPTTLWAKLKDSTRK